MENQKTNERGGGGGGAGHTVWQDYESDEYGDDLQIAQNGAAGNEMPVCLKTITSPYEGLGEFTTQILGTMTT